MKFWKSIIFTTLSFFSIVSAVVYSSCEPEKCRDVSCLHGGTCNNGFCVCPSGFEGANCSDSSIHHFLGYFAGFSTCDNGAPLIDTVFITSVNKSLTKVRVIEKQHPYDTLFGTISVNPSTYSIYIPNKTATNYTKVYNVTVQNDKSLVLNTYERDLRTPGDTEVHKCDFFGTKVVN